MAGLKATPTVYGLVVKGTAIPSIAQHYCKSFDIPHGNPVGYGRFKYIPKIGYIRVPQGRGSFIAVILENK